MATQADINASIVAETQLDTVRVHEQDVAYEDDDYLVIEDNHWVSAEVPAIDARDVQYVHNKLACELLGDDLATAHTNYYVHIRTGADSEDWYPDNEASTDEKSIAALFDENHDDEMFPRRFA